MLRHAEESNDFLIFLCAFMLHSEKRATIDFFPANFFGEKKIRENIVKQVLFSCHLHW